MHDEDVDKVLQIRKSNKDSLRTILNISALNIYCDLSLELFAYAVLMGVTRYVFTET